MQIRLTQTHYHLFKHTFLCEKRYKDKFVQRKYNPTQPKMTESTAIISKNSQGLNEIFSRPKQNVILGFDFRYESKTHPLFSLEVNLQTKTILYGMNKQVWSRELRIGSVDEILTCIDEILNKIELKCGSVSDQNPMWIISMINDNSCFESTNTG